VLSMMMVDWQKTDHTEVSLHLRGLQTSLFLLDGSCTVLQQSSLLLKSPLATPSCCALKLACRHRCRCVTVTLLTDASPRANACLPTVTIISRQ